jgi:diketogulonate reductase-like aldo/keto reductase
MSRLQDEGKVRAIGVSNYDVALLGSGHSSSAGPVAGI